MDKLLASRVAAAARPLDSSDAALDPILDLVGDARIVLIGEASHGTHEFYDIRARLTRRLITEKSFGAVAVEADWPDAFRVNRYVRGHDGDPTAEAALRGFERFPAWMWRNDVVEEFVGWLRAHNASREEPDRAGFYGLDLYALYRSMQEVIGYLEKVDPAGAARARERYSCFEHFDQDSQAYGYAAAAGITDSCADEAIRQLVELQQRADELAQRDGRFAADEHFHAQQNARLVKNAEEYYRTMFFGRISSWNLRDRHMQDTLEALVDHLQATAASSRVVVWAHNSHLGDARATAMGKQGEWNVGQLARERWGPEVRTIGFTTHTGTVTAASAWDAPAERKRVRPSLPESWERVMHDAGRPAFALDLRDTAIAEALAEPRLERAIGVIYQPATERVSHYFHARLSEQFDALIHIDETNALRPLERTPGWEGGEAPETYPFAV